jgi:hypothetical protein
VIAHEAAERRVAEILGGVSVHASGCDRGDAPGIEHPTLGVEV